MCFADDLGLEFPRGQELIFSLLSSPTGSILFVEISRIHKPSCALSNTQFFQLKHKTGQGSLFFNSKGDF